MNQAPSELDHFARLGLPQRYSLDSDVLRNAYIERIREVHPDRFVTAGQSSRDAALKHATALNDAYRIIVDPLSRLAYLLRMRGARAATDERLASLGPRQRVEVFEWASAAEELADPLAHGERSELAIQLGFCLEALLQSVGDQLDGGALAETLVGDVAELAQLRRILVELSGIGER